MGNRLTQQKSIIGLVTTDTYVYDDANRLTDVNGVTYTWDANGNLLSDGVNAYTYNAANQLKTLTGPSVNASYAYNGMGDRLQETHNGGTTNFMMDYNTGLTQVLNDGTNNYIYGIGRIAQINTGTEYFLGDALGSVRQLTNTSGAITYASAYDPYGVTTQTYGASQTAYGYTGEYTSNDMVYLRARYYAPGMGRFLTRDTWEGDANIPITYNRWQYANANPVMYTDPSGNCPFCIALLLGVPIIAGITTGSWNYYVEQGHGVGGRNEFNPSCVDWGQVFGAGGSGTFGAIEPFVNIPLGAPQLVLKYGYGMEPTDANTAWLSYIGLDDEYRAANANPYYIAGRQGGNIGALALSLHALFSGAPTLIVGPGAVSNGSNVLVLSGTNVTAVSGDLSLVYTGTSGLTSSGLSMTSQGWWSQSGSIKKIQISRSQYPEAARHIQEAQNAGYPKKLTIDRSGAAARRAQSLKDYPTMPGFDRDEYPPAVFLEGGAGASVKYISIGDNRGAGAVIGNAISGLPDGTVVEIVVVK